MTHCPDRSNLLTSLSAAAGWVAAVVLLALAGPARAQPSEELRQELKSFPYQLLYETWRGDNWEIFLMDADGSNRVNLTQTPDVDELYPHASPDGTKICFVADEGKGDAKVRSVYYMNLDGTGRTLVARGARDACWGAQGRTIVYLKDEFEKFNLSSIATKGLYGYDLATKTHREHANKELYHLFAVCASPEGRWFLSTVHGGMGYRHAILAIEAQGTRVFDLGIPGCRPEISSDGKRLAWTPSDWALRVADLDLTVSPPKVSHARDVVTSEKPIKVYHIDFPPEGKYVAFTRGPMTRRLGLAPEGVGVRAEGWNICVADMTRTNRWIAITEDGQSNKEPDWVPRRKQQP